MKDGFDDCHIQKEHQHIVYRNKKPRHVKTQSMLTCFNQTEAAPFYPGDMRAVHQQKQGAWWLTREEDFRDHWGQTGGSKTMPSAPGLNRPQASTGPPISDRPPAPSPQANPQDIGAIPAVPKGPKEPPEQALFPAARGEIRSCLIEAAEKASGAPLGKAKQGGPPLPKAAPPPLRAAAGSPYLPKASSTPAVSATHGFWPNAVFTQQFPAPTIPAPKAAGPILVGQPYPYTGTGSELIPRPYHVPPPNRGGPAQTTYALPVAAVAPRPRDPWALTPEQSQYWQAEQEAARARRQLEAKAIAAPAPPAPPTTPVYDPWAISEEDRRRWAAEEQAKAKSASQPPTVSAPQITWQYQWDAWAGEYAPTLVTSVASSSSGIPAAAGANSASSSAGASNFWEVPSEYRRGNEADEDRWSHAAVTLKPPTNASTMEELVNLANSAAQTSAPADTQNAQGNQQEEQGTRIIAAPAENEERTKKFLRLCPSELTPVEGRYASRGDPPPPSVINSGSGVELSAAALGLPPEHTLTGFVDVEVDEEARNRARPAEDGSARIDQLTNVGQIALQPGLLSPRKT